MGVHAPVVLEKSGEANSSCPPAFTHTDGEKEAIPKGRAEKTSKKTKKGKEVAAQKAEAEDGVVIVNQKSCRNKAKQAQKPEEKQQQKSAQTFLAMPSDKEGAAAAIQSAWTSRQERTLNAKKVKAQIVVDNSFEANSSVPQTFTHTGGEKEAIPKGRAEKTTKKKKGGKDLAVQKAKAEDRVVIMNQKSCRNKAKQTQKPEEEQQAYILREDAVEAKKVHAHVVFENSGEANSNCPLAFTHTVGEKEAIPKGRTEKTSKKTKKGEDLAVQKAKAEDGVVIMNQKSCRNKAKHAQKPNE